MNDRRFSVHCTNGVQCTNQNPGHPSDDSWTCLIRKMFTETTTHTFSGQQLGTRSRHRATSMPLINRSSKARCFPWFGSIRIQCFRAFAESSRTVVFRSGGWKRKVMPLAHCSALPSSRLVAPRPAPPRPAPARLALLRPNPPRPAWSRPSPPRRAPLRPARGISGFLIRQIQVIRDLASRTFSPTKETMERPSRRVPCLGPLSWWLD